MIKKGLLNTGFILTMLTGLPVFAGVNYSFTVGTGFAPHIMIIDPYTSGYYSPYYLYNRPYYRNYLYYGGGSFFASPPPLALPPPLKQPPPNKRPPMHLHGLKKIPR